MESHVSYGLEAYLDPAEQMIREEERFYRRQLGCFACCRRPEEMGGVGDCRHPNRLCSQFQFDETVVECQS